MPRQRGAGGRDDVAFRGGDHEWAAYPGAGGEDGGQDRQVDGRPAHRRCREGGKAGVAIDILHVRIVYEASK